MLRQQHATHKEWQHCLLWCGRCRMSHTMLTHTNTHAHHSLHHRNHHTHARQTKTVAVTSSQSGCDQCMADGCVLMSSRQHMALHCPEQLSHSQHKQHTCEECTHSKSPAAAIQHSLPLLTHLSASHCQKAHSGTNGNQHAAVEWMGP